jgi:hypothetical protein
VADTRDHSAPLFVPILQRRRFGDEAAAQFFFQRFGIAVGRVAAAAIQ